MRLQEGKGLEFKNQPWCSTVSLCRLFRNALETSQALMASAVGPGVASPERTPWHNSHPSVISRKPVILRIIQPSVRANETLGVKVTHSVRP